MRKITQKEFLKIKRDYPKDVVCESFHLGVNPYTAMLTFKGDCLYAEFSRKKAQKILEEVEDVKGDM